MYSYAERIRAVKLYIKLGMRLNVTIRQLGYLTKNSLIGWYREYEQSRDLQAGYARSRQKYSAEQRQVAVQHYLDHDRCIASTIRALGYPCRDVLTIPIIDFAALEFARLLYLATHPSPPFISPVGTTKTRRRLMVTTGMGLAGSRAEAARYKPLDLF